jgi:geranylgeranyl diphosphate synthase type II
LREQQRRVDDRLRQLLEKESGCPADLLEAMRYSLLAPGKRLRPMLVLMAAEASGGDSAQALDAGCAVEMIHTYSLIHDDLPAMDDDDLRRGLPTCHKKFGEALAILAGDALLTLAFQVLAEHYLPATAAACCRELARGAGAAGMVGGQVEDLAWESNADAVQDAQGQGGHVAVLQPPRVHNLEALERIHALKTGALFRACLRLGILTAQGERAGGPDRDLEDRLDNFGRCFGMVFQITDDLLDVEGNAGDTGKRTQKDAARGKLTYPGLLGVADSRRRAQRLVQEAEECLQPLGNRGERLMDLLRLVVARDR